MLTRETLGPSHAHYDNLRSPGFTQVVVKDEVGRTVAHFYGPMAKILASTFMHEMNQAVIHAQYQAEEG